MKLVLHRFFKCNNRRALVHHYKKTQKNLVVIKKYIYLCKHKLKNYKRMEIMILKHYSYKVMQRVEMKLPNKSIEFAKSYIDTFMRNDKEDPFLTFVEYYIFLEDEEGFQTRYYKELDLGKNVKKTLENIEIIFKWLKLLEKESKNKDKLIKISVHQNCEI